MLFSRDILQDLSCQQNILKEILKTSVVLMLSFLAWFSVIIKKWAITLSSVSPLTSPQAIYLFSQTLSQLYIVSEHAKLSFF
jgi:hypothetical protein